LGESSCDCFGVDAAVARGVPKFALSTGDRVDAVVGDDVEALVAGDDVGHRIIVSPVDPFGANPKVIIAPPTTRRFWVPSGPDGGC
jgi:hypothetical protein